MRDLADSLIPAAAFLALLAIHFRFGNFRQNELQRLADRYNLASTNDLPYDFPLELIDKRGWARVRHIFAGHIGTEQLLVMDAEIGFSRQAFTRTIVARRFTSIPSEPVLPRNLVYAHSGPWRLTYARRTLFRPSAMMNAQLVEQVWNLLAGPEHSTLTLHPPTGPEILIRPRNR